jgi:hypothetical protein
VSHPYRLGLIFVVCVIALGVVFQFSLAQDKAVAVQKWEYKSVPLEDLVTSEQVGGFGKSLSHYGDEGWELAWLVPAEQRRSYQVAVFKRPK